ncbi:hypothetical protein EV356DRAFT_503245 [Viridothelium virens]|uniref:Secreted protein n=1 Tax=Viridothelium virens TaxID=1048519 RepID=A0A6A6H6K0_VIRVR|nr:hypothetical protein EV356DRAFT_503245 [Viridothelium virens]
MWLLYWAVAWEPGTTAHASLHSNWTICIAECHDARPRYHRHLTYSILPFTTSQSKYRHAGCCLTTTCTQRKDDACRMGLKLQPALSPIPSTAQTARACGANLFGVDRVQPRLPNRPA